MILDALDGELTARCLERQAQLTAAMIGGAALEMGSRKKLLRELEGSLVRAEMIRLADFDGAIEHQFDNSSLAAETVHGWMSEAGLLGDRSGDEGDDNTNNDDD